MSNTIFIYSISRSGGSSLHSAIDSLVKPERSYIEPFSWTGQFSVPRDDEDIYDDYIDDFFDSLKGSRLNTVRHTIDHFSHLDEHDTADFKVLEHFDKVIINSRNNRLRHIVSHLIAENTEAWDSSDVNSGFYENSIHLDLNTIESRIKEYRFKWRRRVEYLESRDISYVDINYENFYKEIDVESRVNYLIDICRDFFGVTVHKNSVLNVLDTLSYKNKQNNKRTYSVVENIEEINRKFGPKYGYLY